MEMLLFQSLSGKLTSSLLRRALISSVEDEVAARMLNSLMFSPCNHSSKSCRSARWLLVFCPSPILSYVTEQQQQNNPLLLSQMFLLKAGLQDLNPKLITHSIKWSQLNCSCETDNKGRLKVPLSPAYRWDLKDGMQVLTCVCCPQMLFSSSSYQPLVYLTAAFWEYLKTQNQRYQFSETSNSEMHTFWLVCGGCL